MDNEQISKTLRQEAELGTGAHTAPTSGSPVADYAPPSTASATSGSNACYTKTGTKLSAQPEAQPGTPMDAQSNAMSATSTADLSSQPLQPLQSGQSSGTPTPSQPRFKPDYNAVLPEASPSTEEENPPARKRLFIGLICGTSLLLCIILTLGWGVPYIGFENIHPSVPYITGAMLVLLILFIGWAAISLVLQVITGKLIFGTKRARGVTVKLLLPLMEFSGRIIGIAPKDVRRSFIQVNNELVDSATKQYSPDKLLILLPHCIQWSGCNLRVSSKLERCKRCGQCSIGSLLDLTDKYGVSMAIATGGTIARRIVVQKRPRLIIAVACERDLASGIQDTHPLPVYGILNQRPYGPCVDTRVALQDVEKALRRFITPEDLPA